MGWATVLVEARNGEILVKIDHVAIQVENPRLAADWYVENFGAELLYVDDSWGFVQFENVKLAFVIKEQHPPHFAFEVENLDGGIASDAYEYVVYALNWNVLRIQSGQGGIAFTN